MKKEKATAVDVDTDSNDKTKDIKEKHVGDTGGKGNKMKKGKIKH